jgi:hypothetical protein
MDTRNSELVLRAVVFAALTALLMTVPSADARAGGTSDAELLGYKGGLVEIGLNNGTVVRGVLYAYNSEHLELEVAKARTAKLHRSRVKWLKAAAMGAAKSVLGAFPADAALPSSGGPARGTPTPARPTPGPTPTPTPTPTPSPGASPGTETPVGARAVKGAWTPRSKGFVFELKLGGNLYTPQGLAYVSAPVSADVMLGYKLGRYTIGARLDFSMAESGSGGDTVRMSLVIFAPTFQFNILESWPLTLYGTLSIDFGPAIAGSDGDNEVLPVVGFRAGAGMRYFVHPRFAVGAETGFRGLWFVDEDSKIGIVSIYGQASMRFIW